MPADPAIALLIVEDEPLAARRLGRLAQAELGPRLGRLVLAETLPDARARLAEGGFDLMVLDLDLLGQDGFDLAPLARGVPIIVVSANIQRAIEAFEHQVVDFVPKPVSSERFADALHRFDQRGAGAAEQTLRFASGGATRYLAPDEVLRVSAADDYVEVFVAGASTFLVDGRLSALETGLPAQFLRVHRSHIVNRRHVTRLERTPGGGRLTLSDGTSIPVSRRAYAATIARLG